jgi:hypothetical protein
VGPAQLFDNRCELWPLVVSSWLSSVVFPGFIPCKVYIDSNLRDTLGYGWALLAESKRSNSTFIMLYLYHEMEVDYLVVEEMINIKIAWLQMHV